jgi:hypothetical protein
LSDLLSRLALVQELGRTPGLSGRIRESFERAGGVANLGAVLIHLVRSASGSGWDDYLGASEPMTLLDAIIRPEDFDLFEWGPMSRLACAIGLLVGDLVETPGDDLMALPVDPVSLKPTDRGLRSMIERLNRMPGAPGGLAVQDVPDWMAGLDAAGDIGDRIEVPRAALEQGRAVIALLEDAFRSGELDEAGAERFRIALSSAPPPPPETEV